MTQKLFFKIIILGDSSVGKTSLMRRYFNNEFTNQYKATIGADFLSREVYVNNRCVTVQLWDTAGQERFQSLGTAFYRGADAVVIVYDVCNRRSFENVEVWRDEFLIQTSAFDPIFMVLGNKADSDAEKIVVSKAMIDRFQKNNTIPHYETSAKSNINVQQSFEDLIKRIIVKHDIQNDTDSSNFPTVDLKLTQTQSTMSNCKC